MNNELENKISELEKEVETLKKDLIHDALTGLKTRRFFEEEARLYFDIAMSDIKEMRTNWFNFTRIAFLFFDLDHFKNVNDTFGHTTGDEVLKKVAEVIKKSIREGDTAARWGGEEIAVTLVGATINDAKSKAEQIRNRIEALTFSERKLRVTASVGIAVAEGGVTFEETLKRADAALYEAKETGRNKVVAWRDLGL